MKICVSTLKVVILISFLSVVYATLSASDKTKSKSVKYRTKSGPQSSSVLTRQLVIQEPLAKDVIVEHSTYFDKTSKRQFNNSVLGYVTPWNSQGYDIAKLFTPKFSHISPVWLQIKRKGNLKYEITGKQDIDQKWMRKLKENNVKLKILPRILFDGWNIDDYSSLFINYKEQESLANTIVETCKFYKLDGVVLEVWSQIGGSIRKDVLISFVNFVAQQLKNSELDLILVIPPIRGTKNTLFTAEDFDKLQKSVSFFSLMTYDYSHPQKPGPNSPIKWVRMCVEALVPSFQIEKRSKLLLGLNFYGYDYTVSGGGPILGHEFIKLLHEYKGKLKFDDVSKENFFEVRTNNGKHLVFFPTLYSISERIHLAEDLGTGISIWELGQGLNYFYDLF